MRIIAALALLLAAVAACADDDATDPTPTTLTAVPSRGPARYLALGDSLSAEHGASVEDETGFVPLVHAALPQEIALLNLGKPGDDSFELLDGGCSIRASPRSNRGSTTESTATRCES